MPLAAALGIDNIDCKINEPGDITNAHWESLKNIGVDGHKLKPEHLIYFGVRDFEEAEQYAIEKNNIRLIKVEELRYRGLDICVKESIGKLLDCDLIYISFDVDSMDCDNISYGTGTPVPYGFLPTEIMKIIETLLATQKVCCIEFTEINPLLDNKGNKMAETAFQVLDHISKYISA
jgi:arginase